MLQYKPVPPIVFVLAQLLVLRDVTIVDPAANRTIPHRTITIRGDRIERIAPSKPRRGPTRYAMAGLIDAHVHLVHQANFAHLTPEVLLPAYLESGVTSVRDTGDEIVAQTMARRYAESYPERCPRVFTCSPLIDGDPPYHPDIGRAVTDPAKVPEFVADMTAWGVTSLKIYVRTEPAVGRRAIEEGHKAGLMVAAHLGKYTAQDAVADGVDVLEHIWSVIDYSRPPGWKGSRADLDLGNPAAVALRESIVKQKTMVDPTLAVFRNMILLHDLPEVHGHADNGRVPEALREHWSRYRTKANLQPETLDRRRREFAKYQELTGLLYQAGVTLLAGTDSPEPFVPPGGALHQELEMLVESGLTPAAALTAATVNNARAVRQESRLGSVEEGKVADLLVLSANPLEDIRNTRKIVSVIKGGRVVNRAGVR